MLKRICSSSAVFRIASITSAGILAIGLTGCFALFSGGGDDKTPETMNRKKVQALSSIAVVGVCSYASMGARQRGTMVRVDVSSDIADKIARGFDAWFATGYTASKVVPLADVLKAENIPHGSPAERAVCPDGIHPFKKSDGGMLGSDRPDVNAAVMKEMANALNVDAVMAVLAHPGLTYDNVDDPHAGIEIYSRDIHKTFLVVVSRSGEVLVAQDIEAELKRSDAAAATDLESAFGGELAKAAAAKLGGR